jgi:hypothetical protein
MFKILKKRVPELAVLFSVIILLTGLIAVFHYVSPYLYGPDSHYHVALSSVMAEKGLHFPFRWAQFSTFSTSFADKDLILHLVTLPFVYFIGDKMLAGKAAVIFLCFLFFTSFAYVLKKFLPTKLVIIALFLPFLSSYFAVYLIKLRPAIIVNIITVLSLYFLITKKWIRVGILSLLYPLAHISFPLIVFFALICEIVRYIYHKEFFIRNLTASLIGINLGLILHPHFPNNLLSFHLNAILTPLFSFKKYAIDFGLELYPLTTKQAFFGNVVPLILLIALFMHHLSKNKKVSFPTMFFFVISVFYGFFSLMSARFWYHATVLIVLFAASYVKDMWPKGNLLDPHIRRNRLLTLFFFVVVIISWGYAAKNVMTVTVRDAGLTTHYRLASNWMKKNIPPGELVYHTYWSDSPYFFCFNPQNNYFLILDPIYMVYPYPDKYFKYLGLKHGRYQYPEKILTDEFNVKYGYSRKASSFYNTIKNNPNFKIRYEDFAGVVYEVIPPQKEDTTLQGTAPERLENQPQNQPQP